MRKLGAIGRIGALVICIATMLGCGDNEITRPTATLVVDPSSVTVAEGGTTTFNVSLSEALPLDGVVSVAIANSGVATVSPQVITFTAGDTANKTITVTGVEDSNLTDEMTEVVISASDLSPISVPVTVTDNDTQALVLTTTAVSMTEGGTTTFGAHLAFKPTGTTVIALTSTDAGRLTAAPTPLTFTAANFEADQTVTLTALEDDDVVSNMVTITAASAGLTDASVVVTIADNDVQGISTTPNVLNLVEANPPVPGSFQVTLNQQPAADVTVTVATSDAGAAAISTTSLVFTSANYNMGAAHVVTVTPQSDTDTRDEVVTITLTSGTLIKSVIVNIADDDVQAIVVTPAGNFTVDEGATTTANVALAFDPGSDVIVAVASADPTIASSTTTMLTFNSTNFATPQPVTIRGVTDMDLATETTTFTFSSTGLTSVARDVTVTDTSTQAVVLAYAGAPGTLTLPEGTSTMASEAVVGVTLAFQPGAAVTVAIVSSNPHLTLVPASLTFTPANYATAQNVTLTAVDETDLVDETADVTFSGPATRVLNVSIPDTDVQSFVATPANLPTINEGSSTTFTLRMNLPPAAAVSATLTSSNPKIKVNGAVSTTLSIPPANTPVTITVSIDTDADAQDETGTITIHDNASAVADRIIAVTGNDAQTMSIVTAPASSDMNRIEVVEQGAAVTFTVALSAAPTATATLTLTPSSTNVAELSNDGTNFAATTSLTFTPTSFGARTVTIRGLSDPNLVDELFTITVNGAPVGTADATVFVRKVEDDAQSIVTTPVAPGPITVTEGATTPTTMKVALAFQPVSTVQVTVTPTNADMSLFVNNAYAPVVLLFTTTTWNQDQTVTLTTPDDDDQLDESPGTLVVSSPALASRTLVVNLHDNDDQLIRVTSATGGTSTTLDEPVAGTNTSAEIHVRLAYIPTAATETITVTVPSADDAQNKLRLCNALGAACGTSQTLTFTAAAGATAWNTQQVLVVQSIDDLDVENETVQVQFASDTAPNAIADYQVDVTDDDIMHIAVSSHAETLFEDNAAGANTATKTLQVHLTQNPTTELVVTLASEDPDAVAVTPATLTFNAINWMVDQPITIAAVSDADVRDEMVNVTLASTDRATPEAIVVSVTDDDVQSIIAAGAAGNMNIVEGASATLNVRLGQQPTANVVLSVGKTITPVMGQATGQDVNLDKTSLTFTSANWNTNQTVVVSAPEDADLDHFTGTIDIATTSTQTGDELGAPVQPAFAVRDNDVQSITVALNPLGLINSAEEAGPYVMFDVKLAARPRNDVPDVVTLTAPASVRFLASSMTSTSVTLNNTTDVATVKWYVVDGAAGNFTDSIALAIDESMDATATFGGLNLNVAAAQAVRGIDNDVPVQTALDAGDGFNGATIFTQRSNIAFAPAGAGEGKVAFTARLAPTGGDAFLGFTDRTLTAPTTGPTFATGGLDPSTEIVLYNADGTGSWDVFSTSTAGIVFARFAIDGTPIGGVVTVAPAADNATDFSVARNGAVYGVIYRRQETSRNNLYFRTVTIASSGVSTEQASTTANSAIHFHPTLLAVPGSFGPDVAPYVVLYNVNLTQALARLTPTGAPLGSISFQASDFNGQNFANAVYVPNFGGSSIWAAVVQSTGGGIGDNAVFLHRIQLNSSGQVAVVSSKTQLTATQMSPVTPPNVAFNVHSDDIRGDIAVAYDSQLAGVNQVGVALWSYSAGARDFRLTAPNDAGLYPSITWAYDRWLLRWQADDPLALGIRLRSGSFEDNTPPFAPPTSPAAFRAAGRAVMQAR